MKPILRALVPALPALPALLAVSCATYPDLPRSSFPPHVAREVLRVPGTRAVDVPLFLNASLPPTEPARVVFDTRGDPHYSEVRPDLEGAVHDFVVAHEYVHAALGPDWDTLPHAVEEGLADRVAGDLSPGYREEIQRRKRASVAYALERHSVSELLPSDWARLGPRDLRSQPEERQWVVLGLGYLIAHELSVEELHELATRAAREGLEKVPEDWLLDRIELDRSSVHASHALYHREDRSPAELLLERWVEDVRRVRRIPRSWLTKG